MYDYTPFWETLKNSSETTYTLIHKYNINSTTITRLRNNQSITMDSLDRICQALNCDLNEVVRIKREELD